MNEAKNNNLMNIREDFFFVTEFIMRYLNYI